jgi:8-oxo-dGTP pyrophosphatase MutT (NUDIX family)
MVSFLRIANTVLAFSYHYPAVLKSKANAMAGTDHVLKRLQSLGLEKKDLPHHVDLKRASVLVPLFEREEDSSDGTAKAKSNLHVLFTQRPARMSSHGGEVCFPGGRQDEEDNGDDIVTATREAFEEVGLHPQHVEAIGRMETVESKHSLCVTPIIGLIRPPLKAEPSNLTLNVDEVETAFAVPLVYFADPKNCVSQTKIQYGRWKNFVMREYIFDDELSGRRFRIWGLTAHIVHAVSQIAFQE